MTLAIVQGSTKGIGFSLLKQIAKNRDLQAIIATGRSLESFEQSCKQSSFQDPRLQFLQMDVTKEQDIISVSQAIKSKHGPECLQYFINSAAYLLPEKSLQQLDAKQINLHFTTNVIGPMLVAKHFSPLLANPKKLQNKVVWAHLSAKTGSIGDNGLGGWHSYRISKAALNQLTKTMSVELGRKGVQVLSLHPGTVDTALSRNFIKNVAHEVFTPDKAAEMLWSVICATDKNGVFLDYAAKEIPW